MNILVTGGAGFIGSNLIKQLLNDNNKILCIDNFNGFYDEKIKENNILEFKNKNFTLYKIDINDFSELKEIFDKDKIDIVINLAAQVGVRDSFKNPEMYEKTNVSGLENILKLATQYRVKNFIQASSSSVYGDKKAIMREDMELNPISPYAETKMVGEKLCQKYSNSFTKIICLRFFTVYGPKQRPDLAINKFSDYILSGKKIPLFGDGTTLRDYTFVSDIVDGIICAINYDKSDFEIFNLGSSHPIKLIEMINVLEKQLNKKALIEYLPMQKGDAFLTWADISKAKKLLNYHPNTSFEKGIKCFLDWYKNEK